MIITTLSMFLFASVPASPRELVYPEYIFTVPSPVEYTEVLDNGIRVFIAENRELPLIQVGVVFEGGGYLDSPDEVGLTSMMASLMRSGGTTSTSAEEVDEAFAHLAASASVSGGSTTITASLNSLSSNFKESFPLFLDVIMMPGFQEDRVALAKTNVLEGLKQRNDQASGILRREFSSKMFGDSYLGRNPVSSSIELVDVALLQKKHTGVISPNNATFSIIGDFDKDEMVAYLNTTVGGWVGPSGVGTPPAVLSTYTPGIYYVDQDVPQGGVRIGTRSVQQGDPDVEAMEVMNYILGGGGFGSRITQSVRSREGLAYSAGSQFSASPWGDGVWGAGYESKSSTVALAAELIFDEIERIQTVPVTPEELGQAKKAIIEQFPSMFTSKSDTLGVFISDEIHGVAPGYWEDYREKINAVTSDDILRVANRLLDPQKMVVVVVGNWSEIKDGDIDGRSSMEKISLIVGGGVTELPIRDPLTLQVTDGM
jgi:zinc protease